MPGRKMFVQKSASQNMGLAKKRLQEHMLTAKLLFNLDASMKQQ
jgi:hypothetical protein